VAAIAIEWQLPCSDSFFIGLCRSAKYALTFIAITLTAAFFVYVIVQRVKLSSKQVGREFLQVMNVRVFYVALFFLAIPITYTVISTRSHPAWQPYALESLQVNGQEQIRFISFMDTPLYDSSTGKLLGLELTGTIEVVRRGTYTIYPMSLKGDYPVGRAVHKDNVSTEMMRVELEPNKVYEFTYVVPIHPFEISRQGYHSDYVAGFQEAESFSWKVLWRIEAYPLYPIYLFGVGAVAQVYPDDSGEFAYVTHVNNQFETKQYSKNLFDIR
jgi:hypothetical protein